MNVQTDNQRSIINLSGSAEECWSGPAGEAGRAHLSHRVYAVHEAPALPPSEVPGRPAPGSPDIEIFFYNLTRNIYILITKICLSAVITKTFYILPSEEQILVGAWVWTLLRPHDFSVVPVVAFLHCWDGL